MRTLLLALTLALTACAVEDDLPAPTSDDVSAPTPEGISLRIGKADEGRSFEVPVGETFAVELIGIPTAGYEWVVSDLPGFLIEADKYVGPTIKEQSEPGFTGGNHWEVQAFTATKEGSGDLVLVQKRAWEEEIDQDFRVTVTAK